MNCKPGDLAFIVRSDFPENIGRIVRVIKLINDDPPRWHVVLEGSPAKAYYKTPPHERVPATEGQICDSNLRPIRPEPEQLPAPPVAVTA